MGKLLRWIGIGLGTLAALVAIGAAGLFGFSEWVLREGHAARAETLAAPDPALLADAPRQARILGCVGCHGEGLKGRVMFDVPNVARVYSPNLTEIAAKASDQQLAAAIRQGIGHDGRGLFAMPSPMYSRLSDAEVAALIAWMRSLPVVHTASEETVRPRALGRLGLATGRFSPVTEQMEKFRTQTPIGLGPAHAAGQRIAANTCSECHGPALMGGSGPSGEVPDLRVVGGYDLEQFRTLMRKGEAPSGARLKLMKDVAVKGFSHFTDAEIEALYFYLDARAKRLGD